MYQLEQTGKFKKILNSQKSEAWICDFSMKL